MVSLSSVEVSLVLLVELVVELVAESVVELVVEFVGISIFSSTV